MEDKNKSSEEIDINQFFILIGSLFRKMTNAILKLFQAVFHTIISFFLFIQSHFFKFVIAAVSGLVIGFFVDVFRNDIYRSTMTVEPNLGSTRQLYSNIGMYNELVKSEDSTELARIFNIAPEEAAKIAEFSVEALISKNRMLSAYNRYTSTLDSTARTIINFKEYIDDFDPLDAETHSIIVDAYSDRIAKKLEQTIISYINNNPYYKLKKETTDRNIESSQIILDEQLRDIDTLKKIYRKVIVNQSISTSTTGGTSISFSEKEIKTKEFELLKETRDINEEIQVLNIEKIENKNIINVVSNFPERGVKYKSFITRGIVLFPLIFVLLVFVVLCLKRFNKYLKRYDFSYEG